MCPEREPGQLEVTIDGLRAHNRTKGYLAADVALNVAKQMSRHPVWNPVIRCLVRFTRRRLVAMERSWLDKETSVGDERGGKKGIRKIKSVRLVWPSTGKCVRIIGVYKKSCLAPDRRGDRERKEADSGESFEGK